jgi:hypothetical protein
MFGLVHTQRKKGQSEPHVKELGRTDLHQNATSSLTDYAILQVFLAPYL